ncbi:CDF family Co(II)/Ni(II) efflux transporter DmeF [Sphingomonas sp. MAH-20]|uniref:CDF family Co(II)/Ni(II) efflux transporter DmeF n=1 Tax=Sphingomonas horti TaxID=2682842 RepID=A0A6I4J4K0_9SPHN|nr:MULTISPECIES: CDF family Co(II)/Ni(II) efflux transporter DmeF [Sphingomonas]MBA2919244.1 CDF family Co(II)/Ni(II) efflux transporter DmeF [Sphingomonas sp. CGMCC 1.13658]MVO79277.1 CDF family Co(II)/Ni(II) efflux transporter DmeF [Sphingomonas horti]
MSQGHFAHDYLGAQHDENARRTRWVVALTAVMMVGEIVAGYATGSMALLADGFHMGTHAGALGVAALAYSYARRHARNPRFSFGTGKVGDLAGFASALVLGVFAIGIAVESVVRLMQPIRVDFGDATLVAVLGLIVNLVSALMLSGGSHHHHHDHDGHHHHHHDNNLRAAYLHVLADALTSVMAIVALLAGRYLGWVWLDPAVGIVGALVIARWSWSLMKETADILLDTTDAHVADQVRNVVGELDASILDLHVWRVGPGALAVIVDVAEPASAPGIRERLQGLRGVVHLTVQTHPEPAEEG